ncbi:MAG TPA: TrmH family RNA methyltransferase [Patescibacteria group bacterium]|nr:TrmH family RNA methyltransferase [Patescibacteria group bacterium]
MNKKSTRQLVAERPSPKILARMPRHPIYVVLDNVRSLENVGLIFRLCDALRVEKLFLTGITGYPPMGDADPRPSNIQEHALNQITKTGIKLVPYVPWEYRENILEVLDELKSGGAQIVSLEQTDESKNYRDADYRFPVVVILGHEREGIADPVLGKSDQLVEIPMHGIGNSLNVATALAVIGYELVGRLTAKS